MYSTWIFKYCSLAANLYGSLCQRTRLWPPIYPTPFPVVLPMHYAHYSKRKGGQVRFTAGQTDALEKRFSSHKYLSPEDRRLLADSLKLTDRQVRIIRRYITENVVIILSKFTECRNVYFVFIIFGMYWGWTLWHVRNQKLIMKTEK